MKTQQFLALPILVVSLAFASIAFADDGQPEYSTLYVFGDSLSDPGNVYTLTGMTAVAPFEPIPSAPYKGSFRFTNGKTWVEQLARWMGMPNGSKAAFRRPARFGNYALGGSRAGPSDNPLFTFAGQLGTFLGNTGGAAPADALYIVWFGGNDIRDALVAAASDPTLATSQEIITAAVTAEAEGISQLYAAGARKFLVLNAPNIALAPAVTSQGPAAVGGALLLSQGFNDGLNGALDNLQLALPGVEIYRFDAFGFLSAVVADPDAYRYHDVVDACLSFFVIEDVRCQQQNRYLFWDAIHPTRFTHRVLAKEVKAYLQSQ
jgi:outer membrane lipase/esterase